MDLIRKQFNFEVKQVGPTADRVLRFTGSDETPDRDDDIIEVAGWKTEEYMKNPVFLWGHNYSMPPIGKCIKVVKDLASKRLMFDIKFPTIEELSSDVANPAEHAKFCDMVYNMYKSGYLSATSVGFRGLKHKLRDDDSQLEKPEWMRGRRYIEQNLLELSAVPVPANPNALQEAKSKGLISDNEIKSLFIAKVLDKARKPSFSGNEVSSWQEVGKTFADFRDAYYKHKGNKPENEEDIPTSVKDAPQPMKAWIASKTLLGDPQAETEKDLIFFPVVNPGTNKVNVDALKAVLGGGGQSANISEEAYKSSVEMASKLLKDEFDIEPEERGAEDMNTKSGARLSKESMDCLKGIMQEMTDCHKSYMDTHKACMKKLKDFMGEVENEEGTSNGVQTPANPGTSDGVERSIADLAAIVKALTEKVDNLTPQENKGANGVTIDLEAIEIPEPETKTADNELNLKPEDISAMIKSAVKAAVNAATGKID